jgi:hypothetical protein
MRHGRHFSLSRPSIRQRHHAHRDDAGAQHAGMFGHAACDIDDAAPVLAVHAVVAPDHGTSPVVRTQSGKIGDVGGKAEAGRRRRRRPAADDQTTRVCASSPERARI